MFPPARTRVATNQAGQDRAAALEAPRRRRPSRLAGRNGRPTNYATNEIPARRLTGGKPRGATLDGIGRSPSVAAAIISIVAKRTASGAAKREPKSVTAEYRIGGSSMLRLTQLRFGTTALFAIAAVWLTACLRPSVHSGKPWHGRSW